MTIFRQPILSCDDQASETHFFHFLMFLAGGNVAAVRSMVEHRMDHSSAGKFRTMPRKKVTTHLAIDASQCYTNKRPACWEVVSTKHPVPRRAIRTLMLICCLNDTLVSRRLSLLRYRQLCHISSASCSTYTQAVSKIPGVLNRGHRNSTRWT